MHQGQSAKVGPDLSCVMKCLTADNDLSTLTLLIPGGLMLTFWLLIKGVDVQKWNQKVKAAQTKATEAAVT